MIFRPKLASILILRKIIERDLDIFNKNSKSGGENEMYKT